MTTIKRKKKKPTDIFSQGIRKEYLNGGNDIENMASILSDNLDEPDWYLIYAKNIINLILFLLTLTFIRSLFGLYVLSNGLDSYLSRPAQLLCIIIFGFLYYVNDNLNTIFGEESRLASWINWARFWLVFGVIGSLLLVMLVMALNTITNFNQ